MDGACGETAFSGLRGAMAGIVTEAFVTTAAKKRLSGGVGRQQNIDCG